MQPKRERPAQQDLIPSERPRPGRDRRPLPAEGGPAHRARDRRRGAARWDASELGLLAAADFLDQVEAGGQMRELTERVIELVDAGRRRLVAIRPALQLSVNLGGEPLGRRAESRRHRRRMLCRRPACPARPLQFEVTEDCLSPMPPGRPRRWSACTRLGATITLDDFGTGHFSLRQLLRLPIGRAQDRPQSDPRPRRRGEQDDRPRDHPPRAPDGLPVVAEGVETKDTWQQLRSMGCERAQGS